MNDNSVLIYREEQKFKTWLCWVIYLTMIMAVLLSVFALKKELSGPSPPKSPEILIGVIAGIGVPVAVMALFLILKLETEVRPDGLYVRYLPFHLRFKRFNPEDFSECYARQYRPIMEYGGWGIRYSLRNGKAYNTSGNQGVQIVFKNGKKLLIGSQNPEELEQAIKSIFTQAKDNS